MTTHRDGPVERGHWAHKLSVHVLSPELPRRVHGYEIYGDVAARYSLLENQLLALTGDLPNSEQVLAFDCAQRVVQAPDPGGSIVHGAILAQLCAARPASVVVIATMGLAEECDNAVVALGEAFEQLVLGNYAAGTQPIVGQEHACAAARLLHSLLRNCPALADLPEDTAIFALWLRVMVWVGVRTRVALCGLWVQARLSIVLAEAAHVRPGDFAHYPMNLPPFLYDPEAP